MTRGYRLPLLFAILASVSCRGGQVDRAALPTQTHIQISRLPLTLLLTHSPREKAISVQAEDILVRKCVEANGFEYPAAEFVPAPVTNRRYGLIDRVAAATVGYALPKPIHTVDPVAAYYETLPQRRKPAYEVALFGDDESPGCLEKARQHLAGSKRALDSLDRAFNRLQLLGLEVWNEARMDNRVAGALQRWSGCMRSFGFESVSDPFEAADLAATDNNYTNDLDMAVAEVVCKERIDLVETWSNVEAEYQRGAMREHQALIDTYQLVRRAMYVTAKQLVANCGGVGSREQGPLLHKPLPPEARLERCDKMVTLISS